MKSYMNTLMFGICTSGVAMLAGAGAATASPILWHTPETIVSAAQALGEGGAEVYADIWTGNPVTITPPNERPVAFRRDAGEVGIAHAPNGHGNSGIPLDGRQTITLTGLTAGRGYQIEYLLSSGQSCQSGCLGGDAADRELRAIADEYLIGTFTASGSTETITGTGGVDFGCGDQVPSLDALVLTTSAQVPEPASALVLGVGMLGIGAMRRRR
jgi:hypothetical protein